MNINEQIEIIEARIRDAEAIRDRIRDAAKNTQDILSACEILGIEKVGIGMKSDDFCDSSSYPFGTSGSIFADGKSEDVGFPIAWRVAEMSGISRGCGNSGQHEILGDCLDGVYRCRAGVWSMDA